MYYISLQDALLQFRGQRIWEAAMADLMSKGMRNAQQVKVTFCLVILLALVIHNLISLIVLQALLSGCSAGGLASILHCDEFRTLFPSSTKVKCLSDAGLFMDAYFPNLETLNILFFLLKFYNKGLVTSPLWMHRTDVSGGHALRDVFKGVVSVQVRTTQTLYWSISLSN